MASALGMTRVIVPPSAGLFSSFGLLYADVEHHYSRTLRRVLGGADLAELSEAWDGARGTGAGAARRRRLRARAHGVRPLAPTCTTRGRSSSSRCRSPTGRWTTRSMAALEEAFGQEHERTYGHRAGPEEPVELVNLELVGRGLPERAAGARVAALDELRGRHHASRKAWFGSEHGWLDTPVIARGGHRRRRQRAVYRRGVRRDLRVAARRARAAGWLREYRYQPLKEPTRDGDEDDV